jgi:hypothetical protein
MTILTVQIAVPTDWERASALHVKLVSDEDDYLGHESAITKLAKLIARVAVVFDIDPNEGWLDRAGAHGSSYGS